MDAERWQRVERIFLAAVDMDVEPRARFLESECAGDPSLLAEVNALIEGDARASEGREEVARQVESLLRSEGKPGLADTLPIPDKWAGKRLGPYRISFLIGKGGMGSVYLAERADGEFVQKVAVKLVKRGMANDYVVERFRNERQILASLNHPYIARLLDGGSAPDGSPYFVMEYVDGEPLHRYCRDSVPKLEDRLRLFLKVCEAVAHAHERRVIHRDLKPGNILVTADGTPRLLDFGLAKLLDPDTAGTTLTPGTRMRMMTPDYASPEQLAGGGTSIRSDIYSLGLMLFELITGRRARPANLEEWDGEITPPSRAVSESTLPVFGNPPAAPTIKDLSAKLAPLDAIVSRAVAQRASARYQTVTELAADLEAALGGQTTGSVPVLRLRSRRWWIGAATACAVAVAGLVLTRFSTGSAGTVAIVPFANLNGDERTARFAKTLDAELVTELAAAGWKVVTSGGESELEGSVRSEGEASRVSARLVKRADQSVTWAKAFEGTKENEIARRIASGLGTSRPAPPPNPEASALIVEAYAKLRRDIVDASPEKARDRIAAAIAKTEEAIRIAPQYARAWAGLAHAQWQMADQHDHPQFEEWMRKAETSARKALELDPALDDAYATLGAALYFGRHDFKSALDAFSRAVEFNPHKPLQQRLLADLLCLYGRFDEALAELARGQALEPQEVDLVAHEAIVRMWSRRYPEAEAAARRAIAARPGDWYGHWVLGLVLQQRNQPAAAEQELLTARNTSAPGMRPLIALGHLQASTGRRAEAEESIRAVRTAARGILRRYIYPEALIRAGLGQNDHAFELLEQAHQIGDLNLPYTKLDPRLDSLHADPRYAALLKKLGLPE